MESVYVKAPVRAIVFNQENELFYGQGDRLHFKGSDIIIPGSERIISLNPGKNENLFITTEFNLFNLSKDYQLSSIHLPTRDRILSVLEEEGNTKLWIAQARGTVHLYENFKFIKSFSLSESSAIFYSASIIRLDVSRIEISFGTIFSGILIAYIDETTSTFQSCYNLEGHKGTIFALKHHPQNSNILVSCSDDRSVRIWKRDSSNKFKQTSCCLGHEARVWTIDICKDKISSVSEDNTCRIWDIETGRLIKCIEYDSNSKSIWSVSFDKEAHKLALGSNDGSVIVHDISSEGIKQYHTDYDIQLNNFVVTHRGDVYFTNSNDQLICLTKSKEVCFTATIEGIKKFPALTVIPNYLFLADDYGNVYIKDSEIVESEIRKMNFKLTNKITKMFVISAICFLMETVNNEIYIFNNDSVHQITIDKSFKVTAFQKSLSAFFIGTRQGTLLVFDDIFSLKKEIKISDNESLKSIKFKNGSLHVIDRLGIESVLDSNYENIIRKSVAKGTIECYLGEDDLVTSFYQQHFIINNSEIGIAEQKIFCGGGHRLWSSAFENDEFTFAYTSNGKLNLHHGRINRAEIVSTKSHGKEIRCAHTSNDGIVLSGSEDGLVTLHKGIEVISSTRLTNTSIKCITSTLSKFYFIGGSNETIEVYEIDTNYRFIQRVSCPKQIKDLETRVLCMDTFETDTKDSILLFVGYSDASIRVFDFNKVGNSLKLLSEIKNVHHNRCVQQLRVIDDSKFITAGADGFITAWTLKNRTIETIWNLTVHDSGINGMDISKPSKDHLKILTGGEDGNVVLTELIRDKVNKITTRQAHNSTVTGVKFYGDALLSASIDRYIVLCGSNNETSNVKVVKRTVISDISALTAIVEGNLIIVYGSGIESFRMNQ